MDSTLDRQLELFRLEAPPDAAMSLLGVYGITNPMIVYLLNRRPDLLAETPAEWREDPESLASPPSCAAPCTYVLDREPYVLKGACGHKGVFRWHEGRPAWVCYEEGHDSGAANVQFIERPPGQLEEDADFDLFAMLGAALEGHSVDLVYDLGAWRLRAAIVESIYPNG